MEVHFTFKIGDKVKLCGHDAYFTYRVVQMVFGIDAQGERYTYTVRRGDGSLFDAGQEELELAAVE